MTQIDLSDQEIKDIKEALDAIVKQFQDVKWPAASKVTNPDDLVYAVGKNQVRLKALIKKLEDAQAAQNQP